VAAGETAIAVLLAYLQMVRSENDLSSTRFLYKFLPLKRFRFVKTAIFLQRLSSFEQLVPLIYWVVKLSGDYDLIYSNTQNVLIVGAIASLLSHCPLVYHLSTWFYSLDNGCIFASLQRTGLSRFAAN